MAKATKANKKETNLPTFLAVSRAIQYSNGVMLAILDNGKVESIPVKEVRGLGSKSSHGDAYKLSAKDANKTKDIDSPNLVYVHSAKLPINSKRLRLEFSMNILAVNTSNQSCNDFAYTDKIDAFFDAFKQAGGFGEIANLIVWRLACAATLWRNRYGIEKTVLISSSAGSWRFDADSISTRSPVGFVAPEDLLDLVRNALSGESPVLMLKVKTEVTLGDGQEVFPSQELEMEKTQELPSKLLYSIPYAGTMTAAMHPQKIGAAVRAFDLWHPSFDKFGPLAIEPLGFSRQHQKSFRTPETGTDLYAYLSALSEITEEIKANGLNPAALFLASCFVRGGVFSASSEDNKADNKADKSDESGGAEEPAQADESSPLLVD